MVPRILFLLAAAFAICLPNAVRPGSPPGQRSVDFEKDVRPIFAASCYECHGPKKQRGDFRLDIKAAALRGGENGRTIEPGKSAESELMRRVSRRDADGRMPPKGPPLSATQIATLRDWIDQGAKWPDDPAVAADRPHWAYQPLVRPPLPRQIVCNPIDAFVSSRLTAKGLMPASSADRRALIRRVYFDLVGLPPTPEEVRDFLTDRSRDAFEKVVDRLLASPHYGERWARHWMDVAHFAETHGHDQDRPRPNAWPYRDYLIHSFNSDKPYGRFAAEQIAGDVLFPNDPQATVALGFLAAGPWDESSLQSIVDDTTDKKVAQVLDRDDMLTTVMTTFVGATVHCARCHNHKFDPISQQDYYALQAVFAGVDRAERPFDSDSTVHAKRRELTTSREALERGLPESVLLSPGVQQQVAAWEQSAKSRHAVWRPLEPTAYSSANGSQAVRQSDGSLLFGGPTPETDTYWISVRIPTAGATAIRLEVLADPSLPMHGPGRQENGNLHLSEVQLFVWPGGGFPAIPLPIKQASADFNQSGWTIQHALDRNPKTAWGIYPAVGRSHTAVFELARPLDLKIGSLTVMLAQLHGGHHLIGRPRLSFTTAKDPASLQPLPVAVSSALDVPPENRTPAQRAELARFVLRCRLDDQLAALPPARMVYAATNDFKPDANFKPALKPRPVRVLRRGDINSPLEPAAPGTISCLPGLEARFKLNDSDSEGERRAALARWVVDPHNVLTWRSIVNRVWHYHFGRGLVDTPNDLGRMGSPPSHPELLDWLAVDFRDSGGSLKRLHRSIVTSAAYRRSSQFDDANARIDADNRFLWRMNRTRLDAESIRDAVLQISGKLDRTMGGPSVKQFIQTPGIHVTPNVDYNHFNVDDPANYRRGVYRFLFRTLPDPFMEALDCPDASQQAPVRTESVTALQALAMLNNQFIVRQSEHLAERLVRESANPEARIQRLIELTLGREARPAEVAALTAHAARFGLANACRVVLNCNEFLFVP